MRIVFFDEYRLGVLDGDRVADVTRLVGSGDTRPQDRLEALIVGWDELRPALVAATQSGDHGTALDRVRLRPPVPRPGQLVCMAGNYHEPSRADTPFNAFLKARTSIIGTGGTVELPDAEATVFHFEPELALLIGKPASHLTPDTASDRVFGYLQFLDVSARGLPGGFFLGKSWHSFAPLGPVLVTADEVADPNALRVELSVDGEVRHSFSTADMAHPVPVLLSQITNVMALEPGDVVATGTHHVQLSPIQGGDHVRVSIQGFGPALEVTVHDARGRTWSR